MGVLMSDQIADQDKLCQCGHFKNCHAKGLEKCIFAKLQEVNGYPGEDECPCEGFVLDLPKTGAFIAKRDEIANRLARGERVIYP